jgi:hypothetical protein
VRLLYEPVCRRPVVRFEKRARECSPGGKANHCTWGAVAKATCPQPDDARPACCFYRQARRASHRRGATYTSAWSHWTATRNQAI